GIITERDIIEKVVRSNRDPSKIRAEEIMSSPLISVEADKTLKDALTLMRDKKIRRLGVTRKGKLVGIITERRVLDALASH
ncbi:MAG: CBS domain-containing protein, partial [Candidatus Bathyarchaeia archaeon]